MYIYIVNHTFFYLCFYYFYVFPPFPLGYIFHSMAGQRFMILSRSQWSLPNQAMISAQLFLPTHQQFLKLRGDGVRPVWDVEITEHQNQLGREVLKKKHKVNAHSLKLPTIFISKVACTYLSSFLRALSTRLTTNSQEKKKKKKNPTRDTHHVCYPDTNNGG